MEDNQKLNFKKHLYSSTFQPMEKLVKTKAHFSACTLVLTSFTWLYSEFIKNTKGITRGKHTANALHLCPLPRKGPPTLTHLEPTLTSSSWFSNILHQKPIGREHLRGTKGTVTSTVSKCVLTRFCQGKTPKVLNRYPLGKARWLQLPSYAV